MLIVHWENLSFPLCVKWKAFLPQCERVIVSQAGVLMPSHSTWMACSPEDSCALSCWAWQCCSYSLPWNGMWWKRSNRKKGNINRAYFHTITPHRLNLVVLHLSWLHSLFAWSLLQHSEMSVGCRAFWIRRKEILLCSAFGLSQFPSCLEVVPLRLSSRLAVGFISYAHCISGPLWVLWQTKAETISVSRIYREALLQLAGVARRNVRPPERWHLSKHGLRLSWLSWFQVCSYFAPWLLYIGRF